VHGSVVTVEQRDRVLPESDRLGGQARGGHRATTPSIRYWRLGGQSSLLTEAVPNLWSQRSGPSWSWVVGVPNGAAPHQIFSNAFLDLIRSWFSFIGCLVPG
jgi:hypothetical protein